EPAHPSRGRRMGPRARPPAFSGRVRAVRGRDRDGPPGGRRGLDALRSARQGHRSPAPALDKVRALPSMARCMNESTVAQTIFLRLLALLAAGSCLLPRDYVYLGAPSRALWRALRIWAVLLVLIHAVVYAAL